MIKAECPSCGVSLSAPDSFAGKEAKCPKCSAMIPVPAADPSTTELKAELQKLVGKPEALEEPPDETPEAPEPTTPEPEPPAPEAPQQDGGRDILLDELERLAAEQMGTEAEGVSADALTTEPEAEPEPAAAIVPSPTAEPPRRKLTAEVYIAVIGALLLIAAGYFFGSKFMDRRREQKDKVAIKEVLRSAESLRAEGEDQGAVDSYREALKLIQTFARTRQSSYFDDDAKRAKEFMDLIHVREQLARDFAAADALRKSKEYPKAQAAYKTVLASAESAYGRLKDEALKELVERIQEVLGSDEIKYGSRGYVFYEDKWVTTQARGRRERMKKEEELRAKGWKYYKGKLRSPEEMKDILAKEEADRQKRLKAAAEQARKAAAAKKTKAKKTVARRPPQVKLDPNQKVWVIDDFEDGQLRWRAQSWGDKAQVTIQPRGKTKEMKADYVRGSNTKVALQRSFRADISDRGTLLVDIYNPGPKSEKIAIAMFTGPGYTGFFESMMNHAMPGMNKDVKFILTASNFKAAVTDWAYKSKLLNANQLNSIVLLVYPRGKGTLHFDNIRLVKK